MMTSVLSVPYGAAAPVPAWRLTPPDLTYFYEENQMGFGASPQIGLGDSPTRER